MAALGGEAVAEAEPRSGAPGAWAEQAPRSSQHQGEPLVATPHPIQGTLSLDVPHNGHTWTPTQACTLVAPLGTSTQECSLHTSPKSLTQEGALRSTPESSTQEGPLHAPTEALVNQEPLHTLHGMPLTPEGPATMKALPVSSTHDSPLHSNSPQEGQFNVLSATVDHAVPIYQIRSPHTYPSTAAGQGHLAENTAQQGSPHACPLTPPDEASLCELSDQQAPLHLHHDTSPEQQEGHLTVGHRAQVGPTCKLSEADVHQDHIIDRLGTPVKPEKGQRSACAGGLPSERSLPDFSVISLLEGANTRAILAEQPTKEGSIPETSQASLKEVEILHHVTPMALSQRESSNATLGSLALTCLTTPKGPIAHTSLDQTGSLNKTQVLEDSTLYVVPSLADSHSAGEPFAPQDTFANSLVDGLIDHLPLDGQTTSSLHCPVPPSLDSPESSSALHWSNVNVVSSLHSTLPVCGTETASPKSMGDPIAFSCMNSVDELTPLDSVVTSSPDGPRGKTFMLVDKQVSDISPDLNGSVKEGLFSVASPIDPSADPLSKISSPVNSLTKVPSFPQEFPNADAPAVVCSEFNTSSFLVDVNIEGTIPVDADTKGPFLREPKGPFAVHVDVKGPFPVDVESVGPFPGVSGDSFPVKIQTQSLIPLDNQGDGALSLDVKAPIPCHDISQLEVHSEVKSSIPMDVDGGYTVNVKIEPPFQVHIVTHSSTLSPSSAPPLMHDRVSRVFDVLTSKMSPPLEVPPGKALSNVAVIEASASVASVEVTAEFALIDATSANASDVTWVEGTSGAPNPRGTLFVAEVERPSEVFRLEGSTAACHSKAPLVVAQVLSPSPGNCSPSQLSFEVSPSQVPLPVGLLQVSSEVPLKIVPSKVSSANHQVSLEVALCQKPSAVAIIPSQFTSSQGCLVPAQSMVPSEVALSRAPLEVAPAPLEISPSSLASELLLVHSTSKNSQGQSSKEDARLQTSLPLEASVASPKSPLAPDPLVIEQKQAHSPTTFSLEEVLLSGETPMVSTEALLVQPSLSLHSTLVDSPIHPDMSLPTTLELPVSAKVTSPMSGLQLSQDELVVKTPFLNNQLLPQDGFSKPEEPLVKAGFNQVEPLLSRNISLPASPFLQDGLLTGLNPGSEVRVTLDHIIEDAMVVSFRLGERIFSGVLMDISKRFGPHGIPVTVIPKREYKNTQSSVQPKVKSFHEEIMENCETKILSETPPSPVQNLEPSRIQSVWTSNPPPLFHEGAPYPPPLFIRDTYNQSIPQPPPRKIRRPKRKLFREEPTSIMNAIKLRPRQVLCDKCKNSVITDKKEIKRGLSASEDSRKRRHDSLTTLSKKLKTNHNVDSKGQTESQKRNVVSKESNFAHGRSRVVRVPTRSNSPKSQLNTKKVLQTKNIEQAKEREVLLMAKEKAQKHMDTPGSKNTHARVQVTRRFTNPSSGTLPPRLRLKPQRYRNEENESSLKTRLEAVRNGNMLINSQPFHITTRSAGEALAEIQSHPKDQDEANREVLNMEVVCEPPGEQEDPQSLDKSASKSNITVYMTLNQDQPGSSSASVCSSEGTDDLKSSHSECSSTENFDFPPGSMHTPPSSSSSSSLKEEKKPNNELKIKVFSKNVSKCIGADGRTICSGDIVWAKIYGFPWWPARILNMTVSRKDNGLLVRQEARISWFGSPTTSFVAVSQLAPFLDNFPLRFNKKRKGLYRKAITEAAKAAEQLTPEVRALLTQFET